MRLRGVIEGFYGEPWSQAERLDLLRFAAAEGFNLWVHAPKDDPYHRRLWREPYPEEELARIAELAAEAARLGVDFAYAIAPGLDLCYSKESEWEALVAKVDQVRSVGIRSFQLLWDDIEHTLNCPEDERLYGHEERPSAAAQAPFTNRFAKEVEQSGPLVVCPMGYAGTGDSPYRKIFGERLDPGIVVYWTGPEVVSIGISREALDLAVERFRGHELLLWDNYPVNDFEPGTLFLGPLRGRDPRLADGRCAGLVANAMVQAVPSKLALATIGDWLRDPHGYDPDTSFERALREYGDEVEEAVRRLGPEVDVAAGLAQLGEVVSDVAVYGATACGVMAAVAAREAGAEVVLVEPGEHVGGMVGGGLSWTDVGDTRVLGGLCRRFYRAVAGHYGAGLWEVKGPEPRVAEELLAGMLDGIDVRLGAREVPDASVVVDASYEGDLMADYGVPFAVGREARELHGERWAGRQPAYRPSRHNFSVLLDPFGEDGELLRGIREPELDERGWPAERLGESDGGLQAYAYRVCLTHAEEGLPVEPPADHDEREFELLRRYLDASGDEAPLGLVRDLLPNAKCDVNSIGPVSLNVLDGSNRDYLDGDREAVVEHHRRYTLGFLFTLAERGLLDGWGFPPDEFGGGLPHQLYVRDARRLQGAHVLTEHDLVEARPQDDVVALGSYNIDVREVERTWRYLPEYERTPAVFNEGYLSVGVPPYPIPYRSLTPLREDSERLLVPLCLSTSHVAFASVRMEPTLMLLGQAAGTAAAQAARRGVAVQDVDVAQLQDDLRAAGQVLAL